MTDQIAGSKMRDMTSHTRLLWVTKPKFTTTPLFSILGQISTEIVGRKTALTLEVLRVNRP